MPHIGETAAAALVKDTKSKCPFNGPKAATGTGSEDEESIPNDDLDATMAVRPGVVVGRTFEDRYEVEALELNLSCPNVDEVPENVGEVVAAEELAARGVRRPVRWRSTELLTRIGTVFQEPEHQFLAATLRDELAVGPRALRMAPAEVDRIVDELLERWGWQIDEKDSSTMAALADALAAIDAAGFTMPEGALDHYGRCMHDIAQLEIDNVPTDSPAAAVRYVVLGTVLVEPVLLALRRIAQQEISGRQFG